MEYAVSRTAGGCWIVRWPASPADAVVSSQSVNRCRGKPDSCPREGPVEPGNLGTLPDWRKR